MHPGIKPIGEIEVEEPGQQGRFWLRSCMENAVDGEPRTPDDSLILCPRYFLPNPDMHDGRLHKDFVTERDCATSGRPTS